MNDGGPAFPSDFCVPPGYERGIASPPPGMSLRDYFAAAAVTGLMAGPHESYPNMTKETLAVWVYKVADAMLAERSKSC